MDWIIDFIVLFFEAICDAWLYQMQKVVPDKITNKKFRITLKVLIGLLCIATLVVIIIGICFLTSNVKSDKTFGLYLTGFGVLVIAISIVLIIKSRKN